SRAPPIMMQSFPDRPLLHDHRDHDRSRRCFPSPHQRAECVSPNVLCFRGTDVATLFMGGEPPTQCIKFHGSFTYAAHPEPTRTRKPPDSSVEACKSFLLGDAKRAGDLRRYSITKETNRPER